MPGSTAPSPWFRLAALALGSAIVVHPLPLALATLGPTAAMIGAACIASFLLLHPALTLPLAGEIARRRRAGEPRGRAIAAAAVTGLASGGVVWLSHVLVDRLSNRTGLDPDAALAAGFHPILGGIYGAFAGLLGSRAGIDR